MILRVAIEKCEHFDDIDSDFDTDVRKNEIENVNEQLNVTISIRFDVKSRVINIAAIFARFDEISCNAIEKFERIDDIDLKIVAK